MPVQPVGRQRCAVADCDRSRLENALCSGHGQRWRDRDRPAMAVFLADPGPALKSNPGNYWLRGCVLFTQPPQATNRRISPASPRGERLVNGE